MSKICFYARLWICDERKFTKVRVSWISSQRCAVHRKPWRSIRNHAAPVYSKSFVVIRITIFLYGWSVKTHLSPMERMGFIEVWSDRAIPAGTQWEPQIWKNFLEADVILLFVSSFFFDSDYCYSKEMMQALQRHKEGQARVVPILVRPVDVTGTL